MKITHKSVVISSKKKLGQNFLIDSNIARKIVSTITSLEQRHILEIGSGFGGLTKVLVEKNPSLTLVEIDSQLADFLRKEYPATTLLEEDFLKSDLEKIASGKKLTIVGNIPYAITSPILFKLLSHRHLLSEAMLMMQLDVAERLVALPKTKSYGALSVQVQAFADVSVCFKVGKEVFRPKPTIESAVVRLSFNKHKISPHAEKAFQRLVRSAFRMRRKTLKNNLKGLFPLEKFPSSVLNQRAEELSCLEFSKLLQYL